MHENLGTCIEASNLAFGNTTEAPSRYTFGGRVNKLSTGFEGTYYVSQDGKNVIIAYAGSASPADYGNMATIMNGFLSRQCMDALNMYTNIKQQFPDANITVTGGSLGGSLAQFVAASTGCNGVSLNAWGISSLLPKFGLRNDVPYPNITNYRASEDILYKIQGHSSSKTCPGFTYIVRTEEGPITSHQNLDLLEYDVPIPSDAWESEYGIGITIPEWVKQQFDQAGNAGPIGEDPILVDLNGDGIKTTTVENGIYFDHEVDGFAETSAWVDENDGILAIDKNNNEYIDDGSEIFGDNYIKSNGSKATSGFDALKDLDSNNDGVINASDENFGLIKILKGNGELLSLEEVGIVSINLNSTAMDSIDTNGNTLVSSSTFTKTDGSVGSLGDFNLVVDKMNSFATEWVDESEEVSALPDVMGFGYVYTLHQAIMRDETGVLKGLVEDFIAAEGEANKKEILGQILYKWTGADKVNVSDGGYHYDGQKLYVMEQFIGEEFKGINNNGHPNVWAAPLLDNCYEQIIDYAYYSLMVQCDEHIKGLYNLIELEYDFEEKKVKYNFDKVVEYINGGFEEGTEAGKNRVLEFAKIIQAFGLNKQNGYEEYYDYLYNMGGEYATILETMGKIAINGTEGDDTIEGTTGADAVFAEGGDDVINTRQGDDIVYGGDGNDTIDTCEGDDLVYGGGGNDSILGGNGNDTIYGEDGNDYIDPGMENNIVYGGDGNDTIKITQSDRNAYNQIYGGDGDDYIETRFGTNYIEGGKGNDSIYSGNYPGNEIIVYNLGDGNDTITNVNSFGYSQPRDNDVLQFGEGITLENIIFRGEEDDLIIEFKNYEGSIRIVRDLLTEVSQIENFRFADGTVLTHEEMLEHLVAIEGTDEADVIQGSVKSDTIYGYGGNDTIKSGVGCDTIYGGDGDDYIEPGVNHNYVYGEGGNDTIKVEHDNAAYNYLNGGDGDDRIETLGGRHTVVGGKGNDYLCSGNAGSLINYSGGNETYVYNLGDGNDTISNWGSNDSDAIRFGEGINLENIIFRGDNYDLIIEFKDNEGSIRIQQALLSKEARIENFRFADGTVLSHSDVIKMLIIEGTEGGDSITGSIEGEKIYGYGGNDTIMAKDGNDTIYGGDGDDYIDTGSYSNIVYGGNGNDTIIVGHHNGAYNYVDAGDGNDVIKTAGGNHTVIGGKGNDYIETGATNSNTYTNGGNETFIYNLGDGNDTIRDWEKYDGDSDTIQFGEGITLENIIFKGSGNDLIIEFKDNEGSIRVLKDLSDAKYRIENFRFADGTVLTHDEMLEHFSALEGSEEADSIIGSIVEDTIYGYGGNDTIDGGDGDDVIYGGDGNDSILGRGGHDTIYGGDGNDYINVGTGAVRAYGEAGNDTIVATDMPDYNYPILDGGDGDDRIETLRGRNTIIGGKGNDYFYAGSYAYGAYTGGYDTFIYNLGDGNDTISNWGSNDSDTIQFGEGITLENIIFKGSGNDLIIEFKDNEGSIRVLKDLSDAKYRIENFRFADGTVLTHDEMLEQLGIRIEGDNQNNKLEGTDAKDVIYGYGGNDSINSRNGNDTIYGGDGNDTIDGWYGDDVIYGENGNDIITGGNSNDTVYGGDGNDTIKFINGINTLSGDKGDDYIQGGTGADTYLYNPDDGNDIIIDSAGNDAIVFGEGITTDNIITETIGENLKISFNEFNGSITINKAAADVNYRIESFRFADGTVLTYNEMLAIKDSQDALELSRNMVSPIEQNDTDDAIADCITNSDINKIIQDMTAYNTAEDGMISYSEDINQEKELMTLVNSSM